MQIEAVVKDIRDDKPNHHAVVSCDEVLGREGAVKLTVGAYDVIVYPAEMKAAVDRVNLSEVYR